MLLVLSVISLEETKVFSLFSNHDNHKLINCTSAYENRHFKRKCCLLPQEVYNVHLLLSLKQKRLFLSQYMINTSVCAYMKYIYIYIYIYAHKHTHTITFDDMFHKVGSLHGILINMQNYGIIVSEFNLKLCYYINFWKGMNFYYLPAIGYIVSLLFFYKNDFGI